MKNSSIGRGGINMENDGLAKLRFDTFIAGTEALVLYFSCALCIFDYPWISVIGFIISLQRTYISTVYSIPVYFPSTFTRWKCTNKFFGDM